MLAATIAGVGVIFAMHSMSLRFPYVNFIRRFTEINSELSYRFGIILHIVVLPLVGWAFGLVILFAGKNVDFFSSSIGIIILTSTLGLLGGSMSFTFESKEDATKITALHMPWGFLLGISVVLFS